MRWLFPQLGEVAFEHEWYGRIGMTNDHLPCLHAPAENMLALTGFNGRGIAPAPSSAASSPDTSPEK
jgi:glycine/D-amino acid oxidase-like deaminating enzyme